MVSASDINWPQSLTLILTPIIAINGLMTVPMRLPTFIWSVIWYFLTGLGITAGYHRYWSHRSYEATKGFQVFLMLISSGAVEGSIKWWSRHHRAHHRFTDSDKDPYGAHRGLLWSHLGWMIMKEDFSQHGKVDISDLKSDPIVMWQHKNYLMVAPFMSLIFPTLVAGLGWGDWWGGYFFAGVARLVFVHHATFCVNSLAHWLGDTSYDDRLTPRDHFITALVTLGEGYHNFHHEFPSDYRNAIFFWQYDPTKWFIWLFSTVGLTYGLKVFPENEIQKGRVMMQQKKIDEVKKKLDWGVPLEQLPVFTWAEFSSMVTDKGHLWLMIDNIAYDVSKFLDDHPGGRGFLKAAIGRDVTASFNGGVYFHSNAARNLMASMRVARIEGAAPENKTAIEE
ncbi:hypothetical protein BJ742DRAFT_792190 [Cladochytrium replicatum]|nr:hypothetical protein BJ742DRAFT_792190 [Cladochytrium replicatum]